MKILKVIIDNFRNITHAEHDLGDRNIFIGPNYKGKTNTILAIYWALTGYMLDGSNDDISLKPLDNTKKEVSVELVFEDGWTYKKAYSEKWTTKRGTKEIVMEGHVTQYYVKGDKSSAKDALTELFQHLGLADIKLETSKFGLVRAVIDPYYMAETCDWAILRSFVIELVGDVSNDDVYAAEEMLLSIRPLLTEYGHDTAKATKHLKSRIKGAKDEGKEKAAMMKGFTDITDVDADVLATAHKILADTDKTIAQYTAQKAGSVNQKLIDLRNSLAQVNLELAESIESDRHHLDEVNADTKAKIRGYEEELSSMRKTLAEKRNTFTSMQDENVKLDADIQRVKHEISMKESSKKDKEDEFYLIKKRQFDGGSPLPLESTCPHCGGSLNKEYIETIKAQNEKLKSEFEENKKVSLNEVIAVGNKLKLEIQNLEFELAELQKKERQNPDYVLAEIKSIEADMEQKKAAIESLERDMVNEYTSDKTYDLRRKQNDIQCAIRKEETVNTTEELDAKIAELKASKAPYEETINKHNLYLQAQERADMLNKELDDIATKQCEYESKLMLVEKFTQTKLSMLQSNVEKVFGKEIKFTLVKSNIKEGSWDEVCYPSVFGKDTPFKKGSESEKIITGIYLIECVKKKMNIPDLPIIFDAGSELDTQSLNTRLNTNAQLIMTKVDDINYTDVTLLKA